MLIIMYFCFDISAHVTNERHSFLKQFSKTRAVFIKWLAYSLKYLFVLIITVFSHIAVQLLQALHVNSNLYSGKM